MVANIIVVFPRLDDAKNVKNILVRSGFSVAAVCTTGAQALSYADLSYMDFWSNIEIKTEVVVEPTGDTAKQSTIYANTGKEMVENGAQNLAEIPSKEIVKVENNANTEETSVNQENNAKAETEAVVNEENKAKTEATVNEENKAKTETVVKVGGKDEFRQVYC